MKNNLLLLTISTLILCSCSEIKDAITVPITTTLSVDVPLTVSITKSGSLNDKAGTVYNFSAEKILEVASNVDMTSYINKIKSVDLRSVSISIAPLSGSEEVLTLNVFVTGITGSVFSKTNITATTNNPFFPVITPAIQTQMNLVEAKIITDRKITITVSGTTNTAPLNLTAKLAFDAKFICAPLK